MSNVPIVNTPRRRAATAIATIIALIALALSASGAPPPAKLVVEVTGFHSDDGQLLLRLYATEAGFPTDGSRAIRQVAQPITGHRAVVELADLPLGTYAIGCVHDENGNGKLDTNLLGIPREGVCASNDARGHRGPPRWSEARFELKANGTPLQIHVRY
jgi:uncharacterized protein (DUF2141 family)